LYDRENISVNNGEYKPIKIASFDDFIMLPTNHVTSPIVAIPAIRYARLKPVYSDMDKSKCKIKHRAIRPNHIE
jgi:hypothetical protein